MKLTVNGETIELPDGATLADLLKHMKLDTVPCAAEVNKTLVPKRRHAERPLQPGDTIELVTLVGGG